MKTRKLRKELVEKIKKNEHLTKDLKNGWETDFIYRKNDNEIVGIDYTYDRKTQSMSSMIYDSDGNFIYEYNMYQ